MLKYNIIVENTLLGHIILLNLCKNFKKMEQQQNNSSSRLKIIIAILAILLVGSLICIFKMTSDAKAVKRN